MLPIDTADGKFWGSTATTQKIAEVRAGVTADLQVRDAKHDIGFDSKVYMDPDASEGTAGVYVIDETKARLVHTGGEHVALLKSRWATFCATPQDQTVFIEACRIGDQERHRERVNLAAESIEESLAGATRLVPVKRGRGRPKGSTNKPKETEPVELEPESVTPETATAEM